MNTTEISTPDRSWAIYANAAGLLVFTNIPFANIIGTFLIWLKVKNDPAMPFARTHARAAFNFQLTWTLALFVLCCALFIMLTRGSSALLMITALPLLVVVYVTSIVFNLVASIIGCMRASDMKTFLYPFAIRFVS